MRSEKVWLTGQLVCTSEAEAAIVRQHLAEHVRLTRAEPGCLSFNVDATEDPFVWRVEECFSDRAAFDYHQERTRASEWSVLTRGIKRAYLTGNRE